MDGIRDDGPVKPPPMSANGDNASLGKVSLALSIGGIGLPRCFQILLAAITHSTEATAYSGPASLLFLVMEVAAFVCGIKARRTKTGLAGAVIFRFAASCCCSCRSSHR
jgi:hypothetical protein